MKKKLLWDGIFGALATGVAVYIASSNLQAAVRWGLYWILLEVGAAFVGVTFLNWWMSFRHKNFDDYNECLSCRDMVRMTEEVLWSGQIWICTKCDNVHVRKKPSLRTLVFVDWPIALLWGSGAGSHAGGRWWVSAFLFCGLQTGIGYLRRSLGRPPRRRGGVTPEGFLLDVEENQGFRHVMVCRACEGRFAEAADTNPADTRTPKRVDSTCPHCGHELLGEPPTST